MSALNAVDLFWSLASGRFSRKDGFDEGKNRCKFALRGLLTLPWTLRWLDTWRQQPALRQHLQANPRLACKLHRPYLYRSLSQGGKLAALCTHYQALAERISPAAYRSLLDDAGLILAELNGKNDAEIKVRLTHQHSFDKEGELSLRICNADDVAIATLTFTIARRHDDIAIIIGGLQGPRKPHGADAVHQLTKQSHGLFPKRLAVEALIALAQEIGAKQVLAVSKWQHIYSSWRYRRHFFADYDSFWDTFDAQATACKRFFSLPLQLPRKPLSEIASKKRAEYQRRYALLDELALQSRHALTRQAAAG